MNDLDKKIQAALRRDPSGETLSDEPNLAEEVITAFRGRHRWLTSIFLVVNLAAFACVIWVIVQFCSAVEVTDQLRWAGLAAVLLLVMTMLKLWFWLEMQTNRVLREVKRVELLILTRKPE